MRCPLFPGQHIGAVVMALALAAASPASAMETSTFGIEATRDSPGRHLRVKVRPGGTVEERLRVWNKTEADLRLDFRVTSARIRRGRAPELGGDDPAVEWVSVEPATVTLGPGEERFVTVTIEPPERIPRRGAVAVLATPRLRGQPAVLQRLGIMLDLRRGAPASDDGNELLLWVVVLAVVALGGAAALYARIARRGRERPLRPAPRSRAPGRS